MRAFITKYKWTIIIWLIFLAIILYFEPQQSHYYLESDISYFKKEYLTPILIWIWAAISIFFLFVLFIKTKSAKDSLLSLLGVSLSVACFLFIFQDLFLASALFINRQFKRKGLTREYVANYMYGVDENKTNFIPYDLSNKNIPIESKLKDRLYHPGLKQDDTITLEFDKGILGISFPSKP